MANTVVINSILFDSILTLSETYTFGTDPTFSTFLAPSGMGQQWRFDDILGPTVTKAWHREITLTAGAATIDLTALAHDILTTVDATGLKLKGLFVLAKSSNSDVVTMAEGASNEYTGWAGADGLVLEAGLPFSQLYDEACDTVGGSAKNIDFASADTDAKVTVIMLFG